MSLAEMFVYDAKIALAMLASGKTNMNLAQTRANTPCTSLIDPDDVGVGRKSSTPAVCKSTAGDENSLRKDDRLRFPGKQGTSSSTL